MTEFKRIIGNTDASLRKVLDIQDMCIVTGTVEIRQRPLCEIRIWQRFLHERTENGFLFVQLKAI
jgi:hypothetical protein